MNQFQELLDVLDAAEMEAPLVRELSEMQQEIMRQMNITERLTNQLKGNRKSYLEVENGNLMKQKMLKQDQKHHENSSDLKVGDKLDSEVPLDQDSDIVNEVTVTSDDLGKEENSDDDEESRKIKHCNSKIKSPTLKKSDESKFKV